MSIDSVGGASSATYTQAVQRQPEAAEVRKPGPDKEADRNVGASMVQPNPAPTVNLSGQTIGRVINTTA